MMADNRRLNPIIENSYELPDDSQPLELDFSFRNALRRLMIQKNRLYDQLSWKHIQLTQIRERSVRDYSNIILHGMEGGRNKGQVQISYRILPFNQIAEHRKLIHQGAGIFRLDRVIFGLGELRSDMTYEELMPLIKAKLFGITTGESHIVNGKASDWLDSEDPSTYTLYMSFIQPPDPIPDTKLFEYVPIEKTRRVDLSKPVYIRLGFSDWYCFFDKAIIQAFSESGSPINGVRVDPVIKIELRTQ